MSPLIVISKEIYTRGASELQNVRNACGEQFDWLVYEGPGSIPDADVPRIIGAYLSADILELSSKTELSEKMADFCSLLRRCEALEFLQVPSAGLDRPIYSELTSRGVFIGDARGVAGRIVALSAFTGMLVLARNMHIHFRKQYQREWFPVRFGPLEPRGIENDTAVIFGVGTIGSEIARFCKTLSMKTIGVRKSLGGALENFDEVVTMQAKADVLAQADWVFLACPLTPETHHLIDKQALSGMKAHAGLINVARGEVVDESALIEALQNHQIRCAYLDVFATEPLPRSSALWEMENVILTPHAAGDVQSRYIGLDKRFRENLASWFASRQEKAANPSHRSAIHHGFRYCIRPFGTALRESAAYRQGSLRRHAVGAATLE